MGAGKGIAGHGNGSPPPQQQVVQIPITKQITFQGVQVDVQPGPDGGRQLVIVDPGSGAIYILPMDSQLSRKIGGKLISTVPVAMPGEMPEA